MVKLEEFLTKCQTDSGRISFKIQNMLEGSHIPSGLGAPRGFPQKG